MQNHWVFEVDLRYLQKKYQRIVFAISGELDHSEHPTESRIELLANIEGIGTFNIDVSLPSSRVLRILEVYFHHSINKIKAFGDLFPLGKFVDHYSAPQLKEQISSSTVNISPLQDNGSRRSIFSNSFFGANSSVHYKVFVLGAHKVGKTSLLEAMNSQICKINALAKIDLTTDLLDVLNAMLAERLSAFSHGNKTISNGYQNAPQVASNLIPNYRVTIKEGDTNFDLNLDFSESGPCEQGFLFNDANIKSIRESHVIIIPVDTPALMEQHGRWHESINRTRELTDLFKQALVNNVESKLLLLVPVKCETYYLSSHETDRMVFAIEDHFGALLNFIRHLNSVACAMVPVQTLGHVVLTEVTEQDDFPEFQFGHHFEGATYSPKDVDQLWTYTLTYLLSQTLRMNRMKVLLAPPNPIHEALTLLLSHRKQGAQGFKIFQGFREMS